MRSTLASGRPSDAVDHAPAPVGDEERVAPVGRERERVLEAVRERGRDACAILVSRLHMLPVAKVERELAYLQIAITKTAGEAELEAWSWLMEVVTKAGLAPASEP